MSVRHVWSTVLVIAVSGIAAAALVVTPVHAADKGLYISPVRQFIKQSAGSTKTSKIKVGNYTAHAMVVRFSVKAFSVKDFSYNFVFTEPPYKQVTFSTDSITLKPNETRSVPYTVTLPANSKPGGQYYTLFATGTGETGSARQQVQATSLIYLTVDGKLIQSGGLSDSSTGHIVFKPQIPFSLTIKNTGNIHYFATISAKVSGMGTGEQTSSETHLLMPGTTKQFKSSVRSPFLPGIYSLAYGYGTDFQPTVSRKSYVVYIPPWFIALIVVVLWIMWILFHRHHLRVSRDSSVHD